MEARNNKPYFTNLNEVITRNKRIIIIIILVLAFIWRLIYFLEILHSPYGNNLAMDSLVHHDWAVKISGGEWLHDEVFFRAPLYPYFLSVIYSIFSNSQSAAKLIQMLLGCVSCLLIYHIAKRSFNEIVGLIALIISSFYGMFLYFENELLIVSLVVFLDLLSLLFLLIATKSPRLYNWFLSGLFLGLSAIARPNVLPFVAFLPLWIYLTFKKRMRIQQITKFTIALSIGCVIPILPVTIHNYVIGNDFVLIASQGGVNFYIGNNPESDGRTAIVPDTRDTWWGGYEDQINAAKRGLNNPNAKPSEISRYWYNKGLDFIVNNPFDFLKLTLKKLYLFWNAHEIGNNRGIQFVTRYSFIFSHFTFKFWLICPLAFAGIYLSLSRKLKVSLLLVFIFSYLVSIIIFFVCARYRMPVIPFLIIFASYAFYGWLRAIVDNNGLRGLIRKPILRNSIFIFVITGLMIQPITVSKGDEAQGYFNEGEAYRMKGDFSNAIKCYEKAKNMNPEFLGAYINMANVYMDSLHDYEKARKIFDQALEIAPSSLQVLYNMGILHLKLEQNTKAREYFLKTLEADPNHTGAHIRIGETYVKESDFKKAIAHFKNAIQINPNDATSYNNIGTALAKMGKLEEAILYYNKAINYKRDFDIALINKANLLAFLNRYQEAINSYNTVLKLYPRNLEACYKLGIMYEKVRMLDKAALYYSKALKIDPNFTSARKNLNRILAKKRFPTE